MNDEIMRVNPAAVADATLAHCLVTYNGLTGDLPNPIARDLGDEAIRAMVTEALRTGGIDGIPAQPDADLTNFIVDRSDANETRQYHAVLIRPKTEFGSVRQ